MELGMSVNENWVYQGRQWHGYFGSGTAPEGDDDSNSAAGANDLFRPVNAGQRVDYVAFSLIMHVPRNDRGRWNSAVSDSARTNLKTAVAAWYGARSLSRDAFRTQFLDPYTSDEVVDRLRSATRGMIEGRTHDDLAKAGNDLAAAAQTIGVDTWPRFLGNASHKAVEAVAKGDVPGVVKAAFPADERSFHPMTPLGIFRPPHLSMDEPPHGAGLLLGGLAILLGAVVANGLRSNRQASASSSQPAPVILMQAVSIPPPKDGETATDVLKPDGHYIGKPGENSGVRELPGGEEEARELFDRLTKGGTDITREGREGRVVEVPGGIIGYRPKSKSGPPTIDVNVEGIGLRKLKFPGGTPR